MKCAEERGPLLNRVRDEGKTRNKFKKKRKEKKKNMDVLKIGARSEE